MKSTLGMRICDHISRIGTGILFIALFKDMWYLALSAFVVVMVSVITFIILTIRALKRFKNEQY